MTYSSTAILALAVHCIVNYNTLRNRHFENTSSAGKTYRRIMWSVASFFVFDAIWGILYDAHLITAVFVDTVLYFIAMTATVFLWSRFVISYLQENNWFEKALFHAGWVFLVLAGVMLILNCFLPVMFWFDEHGEYHAADLRYAMLAMQIIMFLSSACFVLFTTEGKEERGRRHHWAIGIFGIAMSIMVILQVIYPLMPMYSIGCLLGTSILHTFVLEDLKEARRLELEEMLRREQEHKQELGSAKELAYTDSLTGARSQHAYVEAEKQVDKQITAGEMKDFGVIVFDVNGLKLMNDTQGHDAGDQYIIDAYQLICEVFQHSPVFRIGGDEFVVMLGGEDYRNRNSLLTDFDNRIMENVHHGSVVIASGLAEYQPEHDNSYRRIFERADIRMYERKEVLKALTG